MSLKNFLAQRKGINIIRHSNVFRRYKGALVLEHPKTSKKAMVK